MTQTEAAVNNKEVQNLNTHTAGESEYALQMKNISKSFPGVKALDNVQLNVRRGTVHALMGENGAGKSTLMKCLFGIYKMDTGQVLFNGQEVHLT